MNRVLVLLLIALVPFSVFGDTVIVEITYQANPTESEQDAVDAAKVLALRQAMEQIIGVYIESFSEMENYQLIEDEILTWMRGHARIELLNNPGETYWSNHGTVTLRARITADRIQMEEQLQRISVTNVHGTIEITTEISGGLYLDDRFQQTVAQGQRITIGGVPIGRHAVRIDPTGSGVSWEESVLVEENRTVSLAARGEHDTVEGSLPGMTFVLIPGGTFMMGSPSSEPDRFDDEEPRHEVMLDPFYLMTTEVTQALWVAVMGSNPSNFTGNPNYPVDNVSWNDIREFLVELNRIDPGKGYHLPTEAEWEYACRAGTRSMYSSGATDNDLSRVAWYSDNSNGTVHPVAQKEANAWGVYDMHGNVWEWCSDIYDGSYYSISSRQNPQGPESGTNRVVRGGSWNWFSTRCRAAQRSGYNPSTRQNDIGFRLARN